MKKSKKSEDTFVKHIEEIEAGKSSIEDCLDKYPPMCEQSEPLVRIAPVIQEPRDVKSPSHLQGGAPVPTYGADLWQRGL